MLVNSTRKKVLEDVRTGSLVKQCQDDKLLATSQDYERRLQALFQSKLHSNSQT